MEMVFAYLQLDLEKKLIRPLSSTSPFSLPFFSLTITLSPDKLNSVTFGFKSGSANGFKSSSFSFSEESRLAIAAEKLLLFSRMNFPIDGMSTAAAVVFSGDDSDRCIGGHSSGGEHVTPGGASGFGSIE